MRPSPAGGGPGEQRGWRGGPQDAPAPASCTHANGDGPRGGGAGWKVGAPRGSSVPRRDQGAARGNDRVLLRHVNGCLPLPFILSDTPTSVRGASSSAPPSSTHSIPSMLQYWTAQVAAREVVAPCPWRTRRHRVELPVTTRAEFADPDLTVLLDVMATAFVL